MSALTVHEVTPELVEPEQLTVVHDGNMVIHGLLDKYARIQAADKPVVAAVEEGLVYDPPKLTDGIMANLFEHWRVASFGAEGVTLGTVVKVKSQADPTEVGKALMNLLGELGHDTKTSSEWRVSRSLLRKLSVDEVPRLIVNVMGGLRTVFPDAMDMSFFGAAQPPLKSEIEISGDNSNDDFVHALEIVGKPLGLDYEDAYDFYGRRYKPGLIAAPFAKGLRQLGGKYRFVEWLKGIDTYEGIQALPEAQRRVEITKILAKTAMHVALRTDTA